MIEGKGGTLEPQLTFKELKAVVEHRYGWKLSINRLTQLCQAGEKKIVERVKKEFDDGNR